MTVDSGIPAGTVAYMSPEQAQGEPAEPRSDIWSLGVVLYQMLAGEQPFTGDHAQSLLYGILNREPAPLSTLRPEVPAELARVVHRCLDRDLDRRYASAEELLADLRHLPGLQRLDLQQRIDEETVALRGGDAPGRRVRRVEQACVLQVGCGDVDWHFE